MRKERVEVRAEKLEAQGWPEVFRKAPVSVLWATWFGSGFLPFVPGTWGSLAALPVALGLQAWLGLAGLLGLALVAMLAGIPAGTRVAELSGTHDPSHVVIDEVAGQAFALVGVYAFAPAARTTSATTILVAAAFVLFRLFDIVKPGPIRKLERLPGGLGIMADDVASGLVVALLLGAARLVLRW